MKKFLYNVAAFFTNRLLLLFFIFIVMFSFVVQRLFELQIVQGVAFNKEIRPTRISDATIDASRGGIYDRYGRPLAVNEIAYTLNIDNTVSLTGAERNTMLLNLIEKLDENGETIIDNFPISKTEPYTFQFNGSSSREIRWKKDMGIEKEEELEFTPYQMIEYLTKLFQLPDKLPADTFRKLISLRSLIYENRFRELETITIALDVSEKTVIDIEEEKTKYPGAYVDVQSLRRYPEGKYFANMLGYIRLISDNEYSQYKEYGYENNDLIGKLGIEKSMELQLKGEKGKKILEVDSSSEKSIRTLSVEEPVNGNNVFLTIDKEFQIKAYDILEQEIATALIERLEPSETNNKDMQIPLEKMFSSMVMSNNISIEKIFEADEDSVSYRLAKSIREKFRESMETEKALFLKEKLNDLEPEDTEKNMEYLEELKEFDRSIDITESADLDIARQILANDIEIGKITKRECVLMLYDQGIISLDESVRELLSRELGSPLQIVKEKISSGEITPQMTNLDPCTGSLCVVDVNTGEVLALVTYPSYDNNYLVNNFDYEYFNKLSNDPTTPMLNRALVERKAPGSTFKMITAIAGLEMELITPQSLINDLGNYTKAGPPGARCWLFKSSNTTHGPINVVKALEVSCNYFFYELSHSLSTSKYADDRSSIALLNEYMAKFGLNSFSGIEIDEEYRPMMASPESKYNLTMAINPDATESQTRWTDGDTIRAAIGQSNNNFAPIHMARYIATLANGGTRYKMSIIDKITTSSGAIEEDKEPVAEYTIDIAEENLNAVFEGMLAVASGDRGSLRKVFEGFEIPVAAKSGTAQQSLERPSHTWFVGFAPYDNPEIAIAVLVPFGESSMSPAAITGREIIRYYMQPDTQAQTDTWDNKILD